jgi:hypothetical protein
MLTNIAIAAFMMVVTTVIHAGGMVLVLHMLRSQKGRLRRRLRKTHIYWIGVIVLLMFLVSLLEVLVWAAAYLSLNAIQGFERALYFSTVTFTTLGYGDIVIDERWRLLASFEAANGILMFGWTTAIVVSFVHLIYVRDDNG